MVGSGEESGGIIDDILYLSITKFVVGITLMSHVKVGVGDSGGRNLTVTYRSIRRCASLRVVVVVREVAVELGWPMIVVRG